jgi:REP element-mobilizing transposase RayT
MARPLRIEYRGALYHVTSRGDRQETIFDDDQDRRAFLNILGEVILRYRWRCHAYCLMGNHYHLMIETPEANLTKGMRQLNGVFTQWSNRRHNRSGHLFQGRYKAILVDREPYFLELARYIVLNPVRAGMVKHPRQWAWSSYGAMIGKFAPPAWLTLDDLLAEFGNRRAQARRKYEEFVLEGTGAETIWKDLKGQIYLGDDDFVEQMQKKVGKRAPDVNIPRVQQRGPAPKLSVIRRQYRNREEAMRAAYETGAYSYQQIAKEFGVHFTTVGRVVRHAVEGNGAVGGRKE